ncbi:hypothetical protein ACLF3G_22570 [Falsiroseomonas sp. HC035]|uniref:hypothetical protein n=1 Tax=Falsiroseomonas sp. HC035 TaxID=3390999 RepID=UPI003D312C98
MSEFLRRASAELQLNESEMRLFARAAIRNFDALADLLALSPSLSRELARHGIRREALLRRLEGLVSPAYREARDAPFVPPPQVPGAAEPAPSPPRPGAPILQPPRWPGIGLVPGLADDAEVPLPESLLDWPVRNQQLRPTCVGFAVASALERGRGAPAAEKLSAMFVYQRALARRRETLAPEAFAAEAGGTRLGDAAEVLAQEGICGEALWEDDVPLEAEPPPPILAAAAPNRVPRSFHWDIPFGTPRPPNVARVVLDLLVDRGVVVIALPVFKDPDAPEGLTNWSSPRARRHGIVPDPLLPPWQKVAGHAVCVLGFQPDAAEARGGWFIFRNSVGADWASGAPNRLSLDLPQVPARGWGAISASHVEGFCWEIWAPPRPPG